MEINKITQGNNSKHDNRRIIWTSYCSLAPSTSFTSILLHDEILIWPSGAKHILFVTAFSNMSFSSPPKLETRSSLERAMKFTPDRFSNLLLIFHYCDCWWSQVQGEAFLDNHPLSLWETLFINLCKRSVFHYRINRQLTIYLCSSSDLAITGLSLWSTNGLY